MIDCSVKDVDVMDILGLLKNNAARSGGVAKDMGVGATRPT